jgi:hypothetical protein
VLPCQQQWSVQLHRGKCTTSSSNSSAFPSTPTTQARLNFSTSEIDFFKSTCKTAFTSFPDEWARDYCASASAHLCNLDGPNAVRFVLTADGPAATPVTVTIDGNVIIWHTWQSEPATNANSNDMGATNTADALVVLDQGCHEIKVVFEDTSSLGNSGKGKSVRFF